MVPRRILVPLGLLLVAGCIPGNRPDPRTTPEPRIDPPAAFHSAALAADPPVEAFAAPAPDSRIGTVELPPSSTPPPFKAMAAVPNATESVARRYRVVPGDNLRRISDKTGAGSAAIARENGLTAPYTVKLGQTLKIPAGRWHKVANGETGIAIARAYGVEWSRIVAANQLEEPYILRAGERLLLPSSAEVAGMSVEARAAAFRLDIGDLISGGEPALSASAEPARPTPTPARGRPAKPLSPTTALAAPASFSGRFAWPLNGPILDRFGPFGSGRRNDGINIGAEMGAPIRAAADGVVLYVGTDITIYGGLILIRHSDRWTTAYGHAAELLVTRGQAVKRGQIIARAGESGNVTSPQLHFEIRQGRRPVDPLAMLPKRD